MPFEHDHAGDATILILERGAPWPGHVLHDADSARVVVVHQDPEESHAALAARAVRGLDVVERGRLRVRRAALACGGVDDLAADVGRLRIAATLVEALARDGAPGLLAIVARRPPSFVDRRALFALAERIEARAAGRLVSVSLRFAPWRTALHSPQSACGTTHAVRREGPLSPRLSW